MARRATREASAGWRPDSAESTQLARWLRSHRLTVLIGDAPHDTTALLTGGLLPLLGRRSADSAVSDELQTPGTVVPFRERRAAVAGALDAAAEILVLSDAVREATLESLIARFEISTLAAAFRQTRPGTRLVQRMRVLSARHGSRFLYIFDNADALVAPGAEEAGAGAMIDELADVLAAPVDANIVIAWHAGARAALGPFLERLGGVAPMLLDLGALQAPRVRPEPFSAPIVATLAAEPPAAPERAPPPFDWPTGTLDEDADADADLGAAAAAPELLVADPGPPFPTEPSQRSRRRPPTAIAAAAAVVLALVVGVAGWSVTRQDGLPVSIAQPPAPRTEKAAPPTLTATPAPTPVRLPPSPSLALLVDTGGGPTPRIAVELAAALEDVGTFPVKARPGRFLDTATGDASGARMAGPALALMRYDVLSAAVRTPGAPAFDVIAPLYTDELAVLVRADSPLRELSDLAGKRIDAGPPGAARAVAAEGLYRSLFRAALPRSDVSSVDAGASLQRLIEGDGVDAVVLTGAQARALLPTLAPRERGALKLLDWSQEGGPSRAAAKTYLRARTADLGGSPVVTPATMVFLVAAKPRDEAEARLLANVASTLCARLGELRREGDPKWREVTPGLQLPLPWRSDGAGATAWSRCAHDGRPAGSSTPTNPTSGDRP